MFRIAIVRDGQEYFLKYSAGLRWMNTDTNPALEPEKSLLSGSSIGLNFPVEGNEIAFGDAHDLAANLADSGREVKYDVRVYNYHGQMFSGKLYLENITVNDGVRMFDTNFIANSYNDDVKDKTIRDVMDEHVLLGVTNTEIVDALTPYANAVWPDQKFCLPTIITDKRDTGWLNLWDEGAGKYKFDGSLEVLNSVAPQVFLLEILKRCFTHFGYRATGSVFEDERMKRRYMLGLFALDSQGVDGMARFRLGTDQSFTSDTPTYAMWNEEITNFNAVPSAIPSTTPYEAQTGGLTTPVYLYLLNLSFGDVVPSSLSIYVVGRATPVVIVPVANTTVSLNITTDYSAVSAGDDLGLSFGVPSGQQCDVLGRSWMLVYAADTIPTGTQYRWRSSFNMKYCVPEQSITEFLQMMKVNHGLAWDIDPMTKTAEVYFAEQQTVGDVLELDMHDVGVDTPVQAAKRKKLVLKYGNTAFEKEGYERFGEVETLQDLPTVTFGKPIVYVKATNTDYYREFGVWKVGGPGRVMAEIGSGDETRELNMGFSIMGMQRKSNGSGNLLCPFSEEEISSEPANFKLGPGTWAPTIMIFHGLRSTSEGTYPYASCTEYDLDGNKLSSDSLRLGVGEGDVGAEFLGAWIDTWRNMEVLTLPVLTNWRDLLRMQNFKNRVRYNGVNYLVYSLNYDVLNHDSLKTLKLVRNRAVQKVSEPEYFGFLYDASIESTIYMTAPSGYRIRFGDGSSADGTATTVSHTYASPGIYTVKIDAFDSSGNPLSQYAINDMLGLVSIIAIPIVMTELQVIGTNLSEFDATLLHPAMTNVQFHNNKLDVATVDAIIYQLYIQENVGLNTVYLQGQDPAAIPVAGFIDGGGRFVTYSSLLQERVGNYNVDA